MLTPDDLAPDDDLRRQIVAFNIRQALRKQGRGGTSTGPGAQGRDGGAGVGQQRSGGHDDLDVDDLYSAVLESAS